MSGIQTGSMVNVRGMTGSFRTISMLGLGLVSKIRTFSISSNRIRFSALVSAALLFLHGKARLFSYTLRPGFVASYRLGETSELKPKNTDQGGYGEE